MDFQQQAAEAKARSEAADLKSWATIEAGLPEGVTLMEGIGWNGERSGLTNSKRLMSEGGLVGTVKLSAPNSYGYRKLQRPCNQFTLKADRAGTQPRRYKKIDSLIKSIEKFCQPVSTTEIEIAELQGKIRKQERKHGDFIRGLSLPTSSNLNKYVEMMASDSEEDRANGLMYINRSVAKKRKEQRYRARVEKYVLGPMRDRMWALHGNKR